MARAMRAESAPTLQRARELDAEIRSADAEEIRARQEADDAAKALHESISVENELSGQRNLAKAAYKTGSE